MKSALVAIPLLFCLCLPACAPKPVRPDRLTFAPLAFHVPEVERMELPNGIRLYLKEDHELPLVEVTAMVGAGSIGDPAEKAGLGRLQAALLRTGGVAGRSPAALDDQLDRLAATLTAASGTYATTLNLSLRSADLGTGVEILADMLRRPAFDPSRLEIARLQAIEKIRRQDDNPAILAHRILREALYRGHPFGRSPTVASVSAIRRSDLVAFHQRYFLPNNLQLGITGDFDRSKLLHLLRACFGDWRSREFIPQPVSSLPEPGKPAVWVARKQLPQTTIVMGEIGIEKDNPDLYAVRVMNFLLGGGGFNSRFMREIRSNRGLAYSTYSFFQVGRRLPGPFLAGCETKSDSTLTVIRLMRRIMESLRRQPVAPAELKLAKESLINSYVFGFENTRSVVARTMRLDYHHYPKDFLQTYRARIAAVSAADVLRVAKRYLHPEAQTIVLVGNPAAFDGTARSLGLSVNEVETHR